MPKLLLHRLRTDCILGFRRAAFERIEDGFRLVAADRRTAGIYLWGYSTEMILKAAYFSAVGFGLDQPISIHDLQAAKNSSMNLGFAWLGNLHSLDSWATLLVRWRAATPGAMYSTPSFASDLLAQVGRISRVWRESLRYHANLAYLFEVHAAQRAVEWLGGNWRRL